MQGPHSLWAMLTTSGFPVSSSSVPSAIEVTVASIANPATELALIGTAVPEWAVCKTVAAGTDEATWYRLDATSGATNVPYVVASLTAGLKWVAIAGRYVNSAFTSAGAITAVGALAGSNLSGTNTGDVTLAAIGAVPNANAASLSGQALTLQPANASFGGVITTGAQTVAGVKTLSSPPVLSSLTATRVVTTDAGIALATPATVTTAQAWAFTSTMTVVDGNLSITGSVDATKLIKFEADTQNAGFTLTYDVGAQTASRRLTAPALTADATFAVLSETQTFSGAKTFSAALSTTAGQLNTGTVQSNFGAGVKVTASPTAFTGSGFEIAFDGTIGSLLCFDRSLGAFKQIDFNGDNLRFLTYSVAHLTVSSGGAVAALSATGGLGYGAGAGGTVTQATSKSTGVTLNKVCGTITMNNAALSAAASVAFTLTNSAIAATDVVVVSIKSGATASSYTVQVDAVAAGSCSICLRNYTVGILSDTVVLSFAVMKAVAA